ncbi:hypothetical protein L083_5764 [Actinoplanes sp. N902-109]|nr:hypothetical protein L083_5764 [Actinoplanes sp. N902-109]
MIGLPSRPTAGTAAVNGSASERVVAAAGAVLAIPRIHSTYGPDCAPQHSRGHDEHAAG